MHFKNVVGTHKSIKPLGKRLEPLIELEKSTYCKKCRTIRTFHYLERRTIGENYLSHIYTCKTCGEQREFDTSDLWLELRKFRCPCRKR